LQKNKKKIMGGLKDLKKINILILMSFLCFGFLLTTNTASAATNGTTTIISVTDNGTQADGSSTTVSMSNDSRYIAFASNANNLVPNDTNGVSDIFVKDTLTNTIKRISVSSNGTQSNGASTYPSISGNGEYVTYRSTATNLVANVQFGNPSTTNVYLYNMLTGDTTLISEDSTGTMEGNGNSYTGVGSSISDNGRYVVFYSSASNLVTGDTNGYQDTFIRDTVLNTTTRIMGINDTQLNAGGEDCAISGNGQYVAFISSASNLVSTPISYNGVNYWNLFLYNLSNGSIQLITNGINGTAANSNTMITDIDDDGSSIVYYSVASNLVPNDTNNAGDVFLYNTKTNTTTLISNGINGPSNGQSWFPAISKDGHYIAYSSMATNLIANDTNTEWNYYLYNTETKTNSLISAGLDGNPGLGGSFTLEKPAISNDGQYIAFVSAETNLVNNDTNGVADVFLKDNLVKVYSKDDLQSILNNGTQFISLNGNLNGNYIIKYPVNIIGNGHTITAANNSNPALTLTSGATGSIITGLRITGATGSIGILIDPVNNITLTNDTITRNMVGIEVLNSSNDIIQNNIIYNNSNTGLNLDQSNNNTINNNTLEYNSISGLNLQNSSNNTINNNTITSNNWSGIALNNATQNNISNNNINNNQIGVNLAQNNTNNNITNNNIKNNSYIGVSLIKSQSNNIANNTIINNENYGIYLDNSNSTTITENNINNNLYGVGIYRNSTNTQIQFNNIQSNINYGLINTGTGNVNATLNWWGVNTATNVAKQILNTGTGNITYNPWIILNITATPVNITVNKTSTITADLLHDSNGIYHNPVNGLVPYTGLAHFTTTKGTILNVKFVNGTATSTLTGLTSTGVATVFATVDTQTVSTNVTVDVTINQLISAANSVKAYYEANHVLPASVTVYPGENISMAQFLMLEVTGVLNINNGNLNPLNVVSVNPAPAPGGSFTPGSLAKSEYLTVAQNIQNFININGRAPNYAVTSLGHIPFSKLVYLYSKVINSYGISSTLPNSISIA
jgi:parallel beta-helix repeat protein